MYQKLTLQRCTDSKLLIPFYQDIQQQHHEWYPEIFKPFDREEMHRMIAKEVISTGSYFFIACLDSMPCGFMHLADASRPENPMMFPRRWIELSALAVLPEAQHLGVGQFLLQEVDRIAEEKGFEGVTLNFWSANDIRSFYEKAGYEVFRHCAIKYIQ